ncbi:MAG: MFS transporter [Deltaproteobacteria bacterium]|nr:MFS transporter [Deltaproteobacteria bacterium]
MKKLPHPAIYALLYFPFGAMGGFVAVAMTFLATKNGLTITEGALFGAVQLAISWMKWTWAPVVDVTLTPKRWYHIATSTSAVAVIGLASFPINQENMALLLAIVAAGAVVNSIVGMSVEAIMAHATPEAEQGRASGWFQVGNLGGSGVGGGLGLIMLEGLPWPWLAGVIMGASFLLCGIGLRWLPDTPHHEVEGGVLGALRKVGRDIADMGRSKGGLLAAILCFSPVGTGAAAGVLTQAAVAAEWGAGAREVATIQGTVAGVIMALGCLVGGYACDRMRPRTAYAVFGILLGMVAVGMAYSPRTVAMFVGWSMVYNFGVGLAYAAFTATVLNAMGTGSAATKYNLYASISNFPIWWLGLLLAWTADPTQNAVATVPWLGSLAAMVDRHLGHTPHDMLVLEALIGVVGVSVFFVMSRVVGRSRLPDTVG